MQVNKMSKASNYVLEHCTEKLSRVNNADFALSFLVDSELAPSALNLSSKVIINSDKLTLMQNSKLASDLIKHIIHHECPRQHLFHHKEDQSIYSELLSNHNIDNFRYIPALEGDKMYAVVILVNIAFSTMTKSLVNVEPFVLGTIALLKNRKQGIEIHKKASQSTFIDHTTKDQDDNIVEALLKNTFHPTFIFNDDYKVLHSNAASQRLFNSNINRGWSLFNQLIAKAMPSIASKLLNTISKYSFLGHLDKQEWLDIDFQQNTYDTIKVDVFLFIIQSPEKPCFGLMINEKLQSNIAEKNYHESLQRFNALTTVVPMAILQVDNHWNCSYVNDTWQRYTGQVQNQTLQQGWMSCLQPRDIENILSNIHRTTAHAKNYQGEIELVTVKNKTLWVSVNAVGLFNEKYELTGIILTMNDISQSRLQAAKLEKMAIHDHLTGLSNRAFFNDRLNVALSRVNRHGITALMFLDLDRFKQINDTLGHPVGDKVIQEVAKRLKETIRDEDSIARLGGDEFAIIFTDIKTESTLTSIAAKIVSSINTPFNLNNRVLSLSCSIGIAMSENKNTTAVDILRKADLALYKAKNSGRNQFYTYDIELEKDASILNSLIDSLNNLSRGDFSLAFQPQINAATNDIIGLEVLSRWHHPTFGVVGLDDFIKIIEENNLIEKFSDWMLEETAMTINRWKKDNLLSGSQKIAINLFAKQLNLTTFADFLISLFHTQNINPSEIAFEITEVAFIQGPEIASKNLQKLKEAGFFITLDDFGTGYSSLGLLRQMPLDYIKIDRSLINDILRDNEAEKIVLAIIGLANMLTLEIIAEGVENIETKQWLLNNNTGNHQGYYYYKPMPESEIKLLLSNAVKTDNIIKLAAVKQ